MKILHIAHSFVPYTMAGTEIYSYNLAKEQAGRHKVYVFFRVNDRKLREYSIIRKVFAGLETYAINHTFRSCNSFKETYRDSIIDRKFLGVLDEIKPDIVHIHHLLFLSCGIVEEIKKRGIPVIYTLHDYWLICHRGQLVRDDLAICRGNSVIACRDCLKYLLSIRRHSMYFYSILKKRIPPRLLDLLKKIHLFMARPVKDGLTDRQEAIRGMCSKVDLFLAPSHFMKNKFIEYGLPQDKILYSPYGLDHKNFTASIKQKSPVFKFGFLGTLLPMKGLDVLISAFKGIKNDNIELLIYGRIFSYSGFESYPAVLKRNVHDDKRIKLKGGYDNKDIGKILSGLDTLIVPSVWPENSPLVIQEAFLSKTPVIASRIGGIPEMISDSVNGLLFNPGDAIDLRDKMQYMASNPQAAEEFIAKLPEVKTVADNANEMEDIYKKLLSDPARVKTGGHTYAAGANVG